MCHGLQVEVLSFYHMGSRGQIQVIKLDYKCLSYWAILPAHQIIKFIIYPM